jgi:hypothetical protein
VYKYLGIEEGHATEHKNEKEKLKEEYLRRLILNAELSAKNKIQEIGLLAVLVLVLVLLIGTKNNYENWIEKQETC